MNKSIKQEQQQPYTDKDFRNYLESLNQSQEQQPEPYGYFAFRTSSPQLHITTRPEQPEDKTGHNLWSDDFGGKPVLQLTYDEIKKLSSYFSDMLKKLYPEIPDTAIESEDELWNEVGAIFNGAVSMKVYQHILNKLKKQFTIKRKQ